MSITKMIVDSIKKYFGDELADSRYKFMKGLSRIVVEDDLNNNDGLSRLKITKFIDSNFDNNFDNLNIPILC